MSLKEIYIQYSINGQDRTLTIPSDKVYSNENISIIPQFFVNPKSTRFILEIRPKSEIIINKLYLKIPMNFSNEDKIFVNGFQSWTESREYGINERIPKLNKIVWPLLSPYGDYTIYPHNGKKGEFNSFTYTYINRNYENYTLYGSLTEASGYTIFEYNTGLNTMNIVKDCEGLVIKETYNAFDILISEGKEEEVFSEYFGSMNIKKPTVSPCTGWTSWYNYYTGITEEIIMNNLNAFTRRNIPINTFQIDDGYQNAVGDWLIINNKFPKGIKYIAESIKKSGFTPGLWLAPFILEKKSKLFREHKDWMLRDENGKPIKAGFNPLWSGTYYALDFYNEEVRGYLREVFDTVLNKWGFDMVKLDFLYAVALVPRKDKTRGQIMYEAMKFLREVAGDKIILGCGVPLGPSFGLVDYCRIGSDVALKWEDNLLGSLKYRERVSTINSLRSTIGRRHLNGSVFYNDPDVFILREKNNKLTKEQRNSLFILNLVFGGLVFTSDNIDEYSEEEMKMYLSLFAIKEKRIQSVVFDGEVCRIRFRVDDIEYVTLSNLGSKERYEVLDEGMYFFDKGAGKISGESYIRLKPYETIYLQKPKGKDFEAAGGTGCVVPGSDVEVFGIKRNNIILNRNKDCKTTNTVFVKIPDNMKDTGLIENILVENNMQG